MDPELESLTGLTAGQPGWYTPKRLLALFCWLTFLIYLDQGVVASNGVNRPIQVGHYPLLQTSLPVGRCPAVRSQSPPVRMMLRYNAMSVPTDCNLAPCALQAEFQLGNVEDGLLPSAFLAGLLIASIVYSELTTRYNAFRMIGKPKIRTPALLHVFQSAEPMACRPVLQPRASTFMSYLRLLVLKRFS